MIQSRFRRILWFFARVIASILWWDILLPKIGLRRLSRRTRPQRLQRIAASFRLLAIQMGGVMIKVGQFLSARLDVLPREITNELSSLQDEVRSEALEAIRMVIEQEISAPLETKFLDFDPHPLASASIGQVHRAKLAQPGGDSPVNVVVKVQRPNIQQIVDTDLAALRVVIRWIQLYPPIRKRVNAPALLEEFSRSLYEEMDYLLEGKNGETFAANFANRPEVRVPKIYWSHTTRRVLTEEEIQAIKITDSASIDTAGIYRPEAASRLFNTYLKQIFEDRFFHADPHPGNLFVLPDLNGSSQEGSDWQLVFVDFGMTGHVSPGTFEGLREMLFGVGTRDVQRLTRSYQLLGILLPGADTHLLEMASTRMFDRFWGKSTTEMVSMGHQEAIEFAHEFGDLLYEMPFQVPENMILLGRCLSILSGICTGLDPNFNVWEQMLPYAQKLMQAESGGTANVVLKELGNLLQSIVALPRLTESVLQRIEQGRLEVQVPEMRGQVRRLERSIHRLAGAVLFAAFFIPSVLVYLSQETSLVLIGLAASLLALGWMFLG